MFVVCRLYVNSKLIGNLGRHKERKIRNSNSCFFSSPLTGMRHKSISSVLFVLSLGLQLMISGAFHWGEKQIHRHTGTAPAG